MKKISYKLFYISIRIFICMAHENTSYSPYEPYEYLKLIVEDTSIDITCHTHCQKDYDQKIKDAGEEVVQYLISSIEDKENTDIYLILINELKEYCLKIIETDWYDKNAYQNHIDFIISFRNNYKKEKPIKINASKLPFRNIISFDTQRIILNMKFENDFKFVRDVGVTFQLIFNKIIQKKIKKK